MGSFLRFNPAEVRRCCNDDYKATEVVVLIMSHSNALSPLLCVVVVV